MIELDRCPICKSKNRTVVAEFNGLIAHAEMRGSDFSRYDYSLCWGCGVVYATRRPAGREYDHLYRHYNEFLGREDKTKSNLFVHEGALDAAMESELDRSLLPWWQLRDAEVATGDRIVVPLRNDMESQSPHIGNLLGQMKLAGSRVLEIRSKAGFLADFLKRVAGAREVCVMALFPVSEYAIRRLYGLPVETCINFEHLEVPFDGKFDLIIAHHVFVHSLKPDDFFRSMRKRLRSDGVLYLCQEADDDRMYGLGENLFGELRCFHFQQFDLEACARAARRFGFEPELLRHKSPGGRRSEFVMLARKVEETDYRPIGEEQLRARLELYRRWRDESMMSLQPELHALFDEDIEEVRQRLLARGAARVGSGGEFALEREMKFLHQGPG